MSNKTLIKKTPLVVTGFLALAFSTVSFAAVDVDAAKGLARQNNCFMCHGTDKEKIGPSFKKVAEKYHGKADAEAHMVKHLTSGEKAKFPDGHTEDHKIINTKDMGEIKNLVNWILSL